MNTTPRELDRFESALLTELRAEVERRAETTTQSAPGVGDLSARRDRPRWIPAVGTAAAAALLGTAVLVGSGGNAAYAIGEEDGDIVVTINELSDAEGLEQALEAKGINAEVSYEPIETDGVVVVEHGSPPPPGIGEEIPPPPPGVDAPDVASAEAVEGSAPARSLTPEQIEAEMLEQCGFGDGRPPLTLEKSGETYEFTIPGDAVAQDRVLHLTTFQDDAGSLSLQVTYPAVDGEGQCGMVQFGG